MFCVIPSYPRPSHAKIYTMYRYYKLQFRYPGTHTQIPLNTHPNTPEHTPQVLGSEPPTCVPALHCVFAPANEGRGGGKGGVVKGRGRGKGEERKGE